MIFLCVDLNQARYQAKRAGQREYSDIVQHQLDVAVIQLYNVLGQSLNVMQHVKKIVNNTINKALTKKKIKKNICFISTTNTLCM